MSEDFGTNGPGTAVLVVGSSGAGKDTMLAGAATLLAGDQRIVFVRRCITRPPHQSEAFTSMTGEAFAAARAAGAFALSWDAHGLSYGIPAAADDEVAAGRVIVINASRGAVRRARERYARTCVVLVDCAAEILRSRLAQRRRESEADIEARLARSAKDFDKRDADVVIDNSGPPEVAASAFALLLQRVSLLQPA